MADYVCSGCKECLPEESFSKNRSNSRGLQYYCIPCRRSMDSARWATKSTKEKRDIWLKRTYGITSDDYDRLFEEQGEICAICSATSPNGDGVFHVDHDHVTGDVRGILCSRSNMAIGLMDDSERILQNAIAYLREATPTTQNK